jgi:hypothetical protein
MALRHWRTQGQGYGRRHICSAVFDEPGQGSESAEDVATKKRFTSMAAGMKVPAVFSYRSRWHLTDIQTELLNVRCRRAGTA